MTTLTVVRAGNMPRIFVNEESQMMVRHLMIGAVALAASAGQTFAQDSAAGESSFRKCQPCHDVGEMAKNKLGPELNGLDGRKAGTVENETYSQGMRKLRHHLGTSKLLGNSSAIRLPRSQAQRCCF